MKIGIIGAGSMASVLGKRWANNGHLLLFGARDLEKAKAVAQDVGNSFEFEQRRLGAEKTA